MLRNNICEVGYSAQTTVDAKHKLLIDYKLGNTNDTKAMGPMLARAVDILGTNTFTALYDKGYYDGPNLKHAQDLGVKAIVAVRGLASSSRAPDERYNVQHFAFDSEDHFYTCPEGQQLTTNGNWYMGKNGKFKQYKTKACKACKAKSSCTTAKNGKIISRSEYTQYYKDNQKRADDNKELYKQRQAIVEHPYGTIKRQWGFSYISTKQGMEKASADVGLMFTAYNLRRLINMIDKKTLTKYLKVLVAFLSAIIAHCKAILSRFARPKFCIKFLPLFSINSPKRLIFTLS